VFFNLRSVGTDPIRHKFYLAALLSAFIFFASFLIASIPLTASETPPLTRENVEPFLDGIITAQLKQHNIPGAAISVVSDKEIIFSNGYGSPNIEKSKTTNPDTIFRSGSVSKLFIWTAIAQLLDQGKLELDRDINTYLKDITIPDRYEKPITIWNLMTHTSGFEEKGIHLYAPSADGLESKKVLF